MTKPEDQETERYVGMWWALFIANSQGRPNTHWSIQGSTVGRGGLLQHLPSAHQCGYSAGPVHQVMKRLCLGSTALSREIERVDTSGTGSLNLCIMLSKAAMNLSLWRMSWSDVPNCRPLSIFLTLSFPGKVNLQSLLVKFVVYSRTVQLWKGA